MFCDFLQFWHLLGPPKIAEKLKKTRKKRYLKKHYFQTWFFIDFSWFGHPKMNPKLNFLGRCFENIDFVKISQNHWKTNGFHWFLEVRPSKKRSKNDAETQLKKTSEKYLSRIDFDLHFNLRKPPQIAPKSSRDANRRGLGLSLFRDAMDLARKSSKSNGAQRL